MKNTGILVKEDTGELDIQVSRDETGKITQGVQVGEVTHQNTALILLMQPGEWKEQPTVGVGIENMILDHDFLGYKHKIRQQLITEGMQVDHLEINGQNIELNAKYNK